MTSLLLAASFLPVSHFGVSSTRIRDRLVERLGEHGYRGMSSLLPIAAFWWLIAAYRAAPTEVVWLSPPLVRAGVLVVVLIAFVILVVGLATPNPTTVGAEKLLERPDVVRGILRVTRNPFL